jgi:hypothetical protein
MHTARAQAVSEQNIRGLFAIPGISYLSLIQPEAFLVVSGIVAGHWSSSAA